MSYFPKNTFPNRLFTSSTEKVITNTSAETSCLAVGKNENVLAANFWKEGRIVRIRGRGVYKTPLLGSSAVIRIKLGSTVLASVTTDVIISTSMAAFAFDCEIVCTNSGENGWLFVGGNINYQSNAGRYFDDFDGDGTGIEVNTTQSATLDVTVQWDAASTSRSVKITAASIEVLN